MQTWITAFLEQFSYIGIFLLMALENVFPPIPSEVILTFSGFMTTYTTLSIPGVIISATMGSVMGAIVLYGIGYYLELEKIEVLVDRWGHILRLKREDIARANVWFDKYGYWTIFLCRMVPLVRSLISVPAGMTKMNVWLFLLFTTLGTLIWNVALVMLGAFLGQSWEEILTFMDMYSTVAYAVIGGGIVIFLILFLRKRGVKS
ncbi:DedA family protein [Brevibacillus centrosporus]|uniref:DedA family protein n=1 Tax=Brevibacillus centrosporus TaxID=54910 RepID=UPI000F09CCA0|nr:DedA family protein [Brevibacillus centrosporus]MEC2129233.1 DedA family protein [Brevibacillus centrosporus]MED4911071.1 DedA family protein [Brevibacillus centrosporus]RNB70425.1 DedA family protein [Brevibacillus centrosporus]GED29466.1 alkaline phosphatase [Brevibacillus centrosporus]